MAGIKAEIGVDGAAKFRSDMRDAKNVVKELDSELKLADSQFKATGNAQEYMQSKSEALKKQIDAQEKVVGLLAGELNKAKEKYGENSEQVTKLKTALNNAKTSQNNMKTALKQTSEPMGEVAGKTDELATNAGEASEKTGELKDALDTVASNISLQTVADFARGLSEAIESAAQKAKDLGVGVWNLGKDAGHTADDWATLAQQTGFSVEELQKYEYAGRFIDTTLDNITGSMVKFKAATDDNKGLRNLSKFLGTTQKELKSMSSNDRYWMTIDKISAMYQAGDVNGAEAASMQWFGRSAANMNPLLKAGRQAFEDLGTEAENLGYILSEEEVSALGGFDDQLQRLDASVQALKLSLAESLLPVLQPVADAFQKLSDELLTFLKSEEGQAAMTNLTESISSMITDLSADIPDAIKSATELVSGFADAFSDAEKNVGILKGAIITLGAVWAGTKLVGFGADLAKAATAIKQLFGGGGGGSPTPKVPTTPTTPTVNPNPTPVTPKAVPTGTGAGAGAAGAGGGWQVLRNVITSSAAKVATGVGVGIYTIFEPMLRQDKERAQAETEAAKEIEGLSQGTLNQVVMQAMSSGQTLGEAFEQINNDMLEWQISAEEAAKMYVNPDSHTPTEYKNPPEEPKEQTFDDKKAQYYKELQYSATDYGDALKYLGTAMEDFENGNGTDMLKDSVEMLKSADYEHIFSGDVVKNMLNFDDVPAEEFSGFIQKLYDQLSVAAGEAGENTDSILAEVISADGSALETASAANAERVADGFESGRGQMQAAGVYAMGGLEKGLKSGGARAQMTAVAIANGIALKVKKALKIKSPSRVMAELGYFTAEGFALGIEEGTGSVSNAVDSMLGAVSGTPVYGGSASGYNGMSSEGIIEALNGAQVVMDGQKVGQLIFPYINTSMGRAQQRRYGA